MAEFSIQIAGRVAAVRSLFESTRDYCRAYLTEEAPDFSVTVTRPDLEAEQSALRAEALREGIRVRVFPEPFLERSVIQRNVAERLLAFDTLLFHGSAVAVDGAGYLFTADCGTGKSTHTRLWRQAFGDRAVMINDDKPFLRITEAGVLACGAPWSGKHGLDTNITVPLKGICILERGRENRIWPITAGEALVMLEKQGCEPTEPKSRAHYRVLIRALSEAVPLWKMQCNKDPQAAQAAYEAMAKHTFSITNPDK